MSMVSLFCEIDDFFLAFEKHQAQRQLPENTRTQRKTPTTATATHQQGDDAPD